MHPLAGVVVATVFIEPQRRSRSRRFPPSWPALTPPLYTSSSIGSLPRYKGSDDLPDVAARGRSLTSDGALGCGAPGVGNFQLRIPSAVVESCHRRPVPHDDEVRRQRWCTRRQVQGRRRRALGRRKPGPSSPREAHRCVAAGKVPFGLVEGVFRPLFSCCLRRERVQRFLDAVRLVLNVAVTDCCAPLSGLACVMSPFWVQPAEKSDSCTS